MGYHASFGSYILWDDYIRLNIFIFSNIYHFYIVKLSKILVVFEIYSILMVFIGSRLFSSIPEPFLANYHLAPPTVSGIAGSSAWLVGSRVN